MISGEPFVYFCSSRVEHNSVTVAPGRDSAALRCLFSTAHCSFGSMYLLATLLCTYQCQVKLISLLAILSSNSPLDKMSGPGLV